MLFIQIWNFTNVYRIYESLILQFKESWEFITQEKGKYYII